MPGVIAYGHTTGWGLGGADSETTEALRACGTDRHHQWPSGLTSSHFATQEVGTTETCTRCGTTRTVAQTR